MPGPAHRPRRYAACGGACPTRPSTPSCIRAWCMSDPAAVEHAVSNLVGNALKWTPSDVAVRVVVENGHVSGTDHGPGIADEDLPHPSNASTELPPHEACRRRRARASDRRRRRASQQRHRRGADRATRGRHSRSRFLHSRAVSKSRPARKNKRAASTSRNAVGQSDAAVGKKNARLRMFMHRSRIGHCVRVRRYREPGSAPIISSARGGDTVHVGRGVAQSGGVRAARGSEDRLSMLVAASSGPGSTGRAALQVQGPTASNRAFSPRWAKKVSKLACCSAVARCAAWASRRASDGLGRTRLMAPPSVGSGTACRPSARARRRLTLVLGWSQWRHHAEGAVHAQLVGAVITTPGLRRSAQVEAWRASCCPVPPAWRRCRGRH